MSKQPVLPDFEEQKRIVLQKLANQGMKFFLFHHKSTSNKKMSFKYMPYLKKIYEDTSPYIAIMSSVQTGKSELLLIKGLSGVKLGLNIFHVFSTGEAKNSFVKSRINELCDKVPEYKKMERDDRRNMYLRNMGNANWKFVVSNSKAHFDEYPADVVIIDEKDSCNQENIQLADSRMENSNYKFRWYVGNPTVANRGISVDFEKSTKNEWHFKCRECNEWMEADFFQIVVRETKDKDGNHVAYHLYDKEWKEDSGRDIRIRCPHCETLQHRGVGKWIEMNPGAMVSGYHISKLMKLSSTVSEMWGQLKEADGNEFKIQVFYNKILGLPYSGIGSKITAEMLDACAYDYVLRDSSSKHTVAGLDIGSKFDLQVDIVAKHKGKRKKLFLNAFRLGSIGEVIDKIEEFNIRTLCVGIKPERNLAMELQKSCFGKCEVLLIEELEGVSGDLKIFGFKEKEDLGVINVDRTWLLDNALKQVKKKLMIVPKEFRSILNGYWIKSMEKITRMFMNDKEEYKWSKADGDHFMFANAFSTIAWMRDQEAVISGDDLEPTEYQRRGFDGKGNRIIESPEREGSIGILRNRYGRTRRSGFRRR